MTAKRAHDAMVAEDDPHWCRFWTAYPRRESKKDARKMWLKVNPTPELVEKMVEALAWQVPLHRWNGEKCEFAPLPATYLNQERWTDEPPRGFTAPAVLPPWTCPHVMACSCREMCATSTLLNKPRKNGVVP